MPAGEFQDWYRYANTEPFGFHNDERRFASLASATMSASGNKFRNKQVYKPSFWAWEPPKPFDPMAALESVRATFGGAVKRVRKMLT